MLLPPLLVLLLFLASVASVSTPAYVDEAALDDADDVVDALAVGADTATVVSGDVVFVAATLP